MLGKATNYFREYFSVHRKRTWIVALFCVFALVSIWFTKHDYNLYEKPIAKVVRIVEKKAYVEEGVYGERETYIRQYLTLKIQSKEEKGKEYKYENVYGQSKVNSTQYKQGDEMLIQLHQVNGKKELTILTLKRDTYVVFMLCLFLGGLLFLAGRTGVRTVLTMVGNIGVFMLCLILFDHGVSMVILCIAMILIFSSFTLFVIGGYSKKMMAAVASTVLTTFVLWLIFFLLSFVTKDIPYEMLDMGMMKVNKLPVFYLAGVFIGCLGAVMDVSITVNSSVNEILVTSPNITKKELLHSVSEISHDIMGTMINVLFFTYLCGNIPILILKMKTRFTISQIYTYDLQFELIRFLLGALGIVLAIPVSALVAMWFSKREVE